MKKCGVQYSVFSVLCSVLLLNGCGMLKAPEVGLSQAAKNLAAVTKAQGQGCAADLAGAGAGTVTTVPLKRHNGNEDDLSDQWVYWTAGSEQMTEDPDMGFIQSARWDLRVKRPGAALVSANGGDTATDVSHLDPQMARAAFASSLAPADSDDWVSDRNTSLEYGELRLAPEDLNPLVNQPPPFPGSGASGPATGMLSGYNTHGHHEIELSGNVFFLRTTSGKEFYALRFCEYSRAGNWLKFQWKKIETESTL